MAQKSAFYSAYVLTIPSGHWVRVQSSNVAAYARATARASTGIAGRGVTYVEFNNGTRYAYEIDESTYQSFIAAAASSNGKAVWDVLRSAGGQRPVPGKPPLDTIPCFGPL